MCECVCFCVSLCLSLYMCKYVSLCVCMCVYLCECLCVSMCYPMSLCVFAFASVSIHLHFSVCLSVYMCVSACVYIYTDTHFSHMHFYFEWFICSLHIFIIYHPQIYVLMRMKNINQSQCCECFSLCSFLIVRNFCTIFFISCSL